MKSEEQKPPDAAKRQRTQEVQTEGLKMDIAEESEEASEAEATKYLQLILLKSVESLLDIVLGRPFLPLPTAFATGAVAMPEWTSTQEQLEHNFQMLLAWKSDFFKEEVAALLDKAGVALELHAARQGGAFEHVSIEGCNLFCL